MFVTRRRFDELQRQAADLDGVLHMQMEENQRLLALLETAIKIRKPRSKQEVIPVSPSEKPEPMPAIIQRAIETTFPGDQQIYAANMTYAHSQAHRWEAEAEEVASEIRIGRQ